LTRLDATSEEVSDLHASVDSVFLIVYKQLPVLLLEDHSILINMGIEAGGSEWTGSAVLEVLALHLRERLFVSLHEELLLSASDIFRRRTDEEGLFRAEGTSPAERRERVKETEKEREREGERGRKKERKKERKR
jgi:hypothetical protein